MSHTRGPWHVVANPDKIGENWMVASNGDYVIETDGLKSDELGDTLDDADLIAAAPELLKALQDIVTYCECAPAQGDARMLYELFHTAKAAIAKATGETL